MGCRRAEGRCRSTIDPTARTFSGRNLPIIENLAYDSGPCPTHFPSGKKQKKAVTGLVAQITPQPRISQTFGRLQQMESLRERRGSGVLLHLPFVDPGQRYLFGPSAGITTERI
jgi:hypothetical protein